MRIGELAEATGTTTKTLRFYEASGLLPLPNRTPAGYRLYEEDAVALLDFIRRGRAAGLTLAQIRDILPARPAARPPRHRGPAPRRRRQRRTRHLPTRASLPLPVARPCRRESP